MAPVGVHARSLDCLWEHCYAAAERLVLEATEGSSESNQQRESQVSFTAEAQEVSLPHDWSQQLQSAYPKRSGPCGWMGTRLMLAIRRALMTTTWENLLEKAKEYRTYCQQSGTEGTVYTLKPESWLDQGIYLEDLIFQEPVSPKEAVAQDRKIREASALSVAKKRAEALGIPYGPLDSLEALETRCKRAELERKIGTPRAEGAHLGVAARITDISNKLKRIG